MTTNEMMLAKAFRENAGLEQAKAEALASTIFDAIRDNVATKTDVELVRADLKISETALRGDLQALRGNLNTTETALRGDLKSEVQTLKIWTGGIAFAAVSALFVALHYWPPHVTP